MVARYKDSRLMAGFTLIELLVVVAIMVILMALIIPALNGLRDRQMRLVANNDLEGMTLAISQYMLDYGVLGEDGDSGDFIDRPLLFLTATPSRNGKTVYFEPDRKRIRHIDDEGNTTAVTSYTEAHVLVDPWGVPYQFTIDNVTRRGLTAPNKIRIFTHAGNEELNENSLGRFLDISAGEWRSLRGKDVLP